MQRFEDVRLFRVHGQHDALGLGPSLPQPLGRLEAMHVRHGDIEDGHLRLGRLGQPPGLRAIGGLANDVHPRLLHEDPDSLADHDRRVGQEEAPRP